MRAARGAAPATLFTQGRQQTIFSHGPAALPPFKPEPVTHQLAHHAATVVVTQHQMTDSSFDEPGHPAADGRAHHLAMGLPPDRIEQGREGSRKTPSAYQQTWLWVGVSA